MKLALYPRIIPIIWYIGFKLNWLYSYTHIALYNIQGNPLKSAATNW